MDPSFADGPVGEALAQAAAAAGARVRTHVGTVVEPASLPTSPALDAWLAGEEETRARVTTALVDLAGRRGTVTAADIGSLVAGHRPPPRGVQGDDESSLLQQVKLLWRAGYLAGHDVPQLHVDVVGL